MADTVTRKSLEVVLSLNEEEARYLKDMLQNYLGENLEDEPPADNRSRRSIFDALQEALT